ncbi:MAG: phosphoglycerate kinase [Oligoflexia bacterium]|nr:phosphoglycerate kinase [Oligoflexia bacterium]
MSISKTIRSVEDVKLEGKKVFIRLDLNVPISGEGAARKIDDDTRIQEALPTIKYCLEKGAKLILCSHLGRPDGKRNKKYSLELVGQKLAELLGVEVLLSDDSVGDGVHQMIHHSKEHQVILLENIRFHEEEEKNDPDFSRELSHLADIYITDAFGTAHRKHASTYGVPSVMTEKACGFLIQKELKFLNKLIESPNHPYVLVAGGSKVTDKLKALENMLNFVDRLVIGGAMAYAFLAAQGKTIGKSKCEEEGIAAAGMILKKAESHKVEVFLPIDHVVVEPESDPDFSNPKVVKEISANQAALDIGPQTVALFSEKIREAKTIFWNGPMGFFEKEKFSAGTLAIAREISAIDGIKVAGGGDTLSAVHSFSLESRFDLLSTGGGASLKYLEGRGLPGIDILKGK